MIMILLLVVGILCTIAYGTAWVAQTILEMSSWSSTTKLAAVGALIALVIAAVLTILNTVVDLIIMGAM